VVTSPESCPGCGFIWDQVEPHDVAPHLLEAAGQVATLLVANADTARTRPEPARWSTLEYAAHLRDVLLNVRDRLVLCAVEDNPSPYPLYREERVTFGLYAGEDPATVASDLEAAARLFTVAFDTLSPAALERPVIYSRVLNDQRTFRWMGAQGLHEAQHHLDDVRENVTRLNGNAPQSM
jgi:hypothetical protein